MPKLKIIKNRHPVDRLFDIREQIKALEAEEKSLRADIMDSGNLVGDDYIGNVKEFTRKTLDRPALEAHFGKSVIDGFCKETAYSTLYLFKKAMQRVDVFK